MVTTGKNIGQNFLIGARQHPDLLAIITETQVLNYSHLANLVISFACKMQKLDVNQTSVIVLETDDVAQVLASLFASSLLGAQWISHRSEKILKGVVNPTHWFSKRDVAPNQDFENHLERRKRNLHFVDESWSVVSEGVPEFELQVPHSPWLYVSTSGTTGYSKLISISQEITFDRSIAVRDDFKTRKTVFCSLFYCLAYPFLTRAIAAMLNCCTLVYSTNADLWKRSGVNLVMGSPSQAEEVFEKSHTGERFPEIHLAGAKLTDVLGRTL